MHHNAGRQLEMLDCSVSARDANNKVGTFGNYSKTLTLKREKLDLVFVILTSVSVN